MDERRTGKVKNAIRLEKIIHRVKKYRNKEKKLLSFSLFENATGT